MMHVTSVGKVQALHSPPHVLLTYPRAYYSRCCLICNALAPDRVQLSSACACMSVLLGGQVVPARRQSISQVGESLSGCRFKVIARFRQHGMGPHRRSHTACAGPAAGDPGPSERDNMLAGRQYYPTDPELLHQRLSCRAKLKAFNNSDGLTAEEQRQRLLLLESLVGSFSDLHPPIIEPPLNCDYVRFSSCCLCMHCNWAHVKRRVWLMCHGLSTMQGYNLHIGEEVYMNFGCVLLDCNIITIGAYSHCCTAVDGNIAWPLS